MGPAYKRLPSPVPVPAQPHGRHRSGRRWSAVSRRSPVCTRWAWASASSAAATIEARPRSCGRRGRRCPGRCRRSRRRRRSGIATRSPVTGRHLRRGAVHRRRPIPRPWPARAAEPVSRRRSPPPTPRSADVARIVIDPVTRVGGHLRVEVDVAVGAVTEAPGSPPRCSGTSSPSFAAATRGTPGCSRSASAGPAPACTRSRRSARWRTPSASRSRRTPGWCATCSPPRSSSATTSSASTRRRARTGWTRKSRSNADPAATSRLARRRSLWPQSGATYFSGVRDRLAAVDRARTSPACSANGCWGHPAYRLSPGAEPPAAGPPARGARLAARRSCGSTPSSAARTRTRRRTSSAAWPWRRRGAARPPPVNREHPQVPDRNCADRPERRTGSTMIEVCSRGPRPSSTRCSLPDVRLLAGAYPEWAQRSVPAPGSYLAVRRLPAATAARTPPCSCRAAASRAATCSQCSRGGPGRASPRP